MLWLARPVHAVAKHLQHHLHAAMARLQRQTPNSLQNEMPHVPLTTYVTSPRNVLDTGHLKNSRSTAPGPQAGLADRSEYNEGPGGREALSAERLFEERLCISCLDPAGARPNMSAGLAGAALLLQRSSTAAATV